MSEATPSRPAEWGMAGLSVNVVPTAHAAQSYTAAQQADQPGLLRLTQRDAAQDVLQLLGIGQHSVEKGSIDGARQKRIHLDAAKHTAPLVFVWCVCGVLA